MLDDEKWILTESPALLLNLEQCMRDMWLGFIGIGGSGMGALFLDGFSGRLNCGRFDLVSWHLEVSSGLDAVRVQSS